MIRAAIRSGEPVSAIRTRMRPDAERQPEAAAKDVAWVATLPDGGPTGVLFRGQHLAPC
jgi:hypothetical protein